MSQSISKEALDQLFMDARTHNTWHKESVPETVLHKVWEIMRMAPTSTNCSPARIVFVTSTAAKEKLKPCLIESNVEKTMAAPVTAIIGQDLAFAEKLPTLFPHTDAKSWFEGNDALIEETAFRNSSLQGAYLIMAVRALGLDCGPMSGFDKEKVDAAFFAGTSIKSNFLCNLGYGDPEGLFLRSPRLEFAEACRVE